jgi:hypothetical protein
LIAIDRQRKPQSSAELRIVIDNQNLRQPQQALPKRSIPLADPSIIRIRYKESINLTL